MIKDLIKLNDVAVETYVGAINRLVNPKYKQTLSTFISEHLSHKAVLSAIVEDLNLQMSASSIVEITLLIDKMNVIDMFGDEAILAAMQNNEGYINAAYECVLYHENFDEAMRVVVEHCLVCGQRHRSWIINTLKSIH